MYLLENAVQHYDWGKIGYDSYVSKFQKKVRHNKPYAELWMGTHEKAESKVVTSFFRKMPLSKFIKYKLPFLFKVLSIKKPLSIQVHPDKKMAERLHKKHPDIYIDDNHKPEMFYTLGKFELLCGFRPSDKITEMLLLYEEEFENAIGNVIIRDDIDLKVAFNNLLNLNKSIVRSLIKHILRNITKIKNPLFQNLFLKLNDNYPYDVGVLTIFFLNYIILPAEHVIFLKANVPHSYISGNCLEIMASSDNVIRCGLTQKFRDTELLCKILDYGYKRPRVSISAGSLSVYQPTNEFGLMIIKHEGKKEDWYVVNTDIDFIMLVLECDRKNYDNIKQNRTYLMRRNNIKLSCTCKVVCAYKPRR